MKKTLITAGIVGLLLSGCAFSSSVVNVANGIISTFSEVEKEFMPDFANISISIETVDKNSLKASEENKKTTQKVIDAINSKLDAKAGEKLSTVNFVVYPNYSTNGKNNVTGYTCRNIILVKVKDLAKPGLIIDTAINNGASKINNIIFDIEDEQNICNGLLPDAINNTRVRAGIIAKGLNVQISGVSKVSSSCYVQNSSNIITYANARKAASMDMASGSNFESTSTTPIEPKAIKVRANVNVDYKIK